MNGSLDGRLHFCDFTLDAAEEQLWCKAEAITLRPKTFALLAYLAARPGRTITKRELLEAIWVDATVGEWVLATSIKELRRALGDDSRHPSLIETKHGRGYRFIAEVRSGGQEGEQTSVGGAPARLVGREAELTQLDGWFQQAQAGTRQVVFVVGEAGIGKSTLVDQFIRGLAVKGPPCLVAYGQCLEQYSTSEPYLPIIEAFGQLCATPDGAPLLPLLRQLAPSWLGLLPALAPASVTGESRPATPERMLREMAAVVEALTIPLVLVLEDLHWSDPATVDLVARLAQGRGSTPLLVIGTYRAADVALRSHPLKGVHQELWARGQCRDLWLEPLDTAAVTAYVQQRFPGFAQTAALATVVFKRTDGNALFLVNAIDNLVATSAMVESDGRWRLAAAVDEIAVSVPAGLRQLLTARLERHGERERAALDAGSVAGRTFSAAEAAAALDLPVVEVEAELDSLARRSQVLRPAGASLWPDDTGAGRYEFIHTLYQDVLYDLVPQARRGLWHGRIAERLERGYAGHTVDIAAQLARHFEAGGMRERAIAYLEEAAARASRYGAERAAAALLEQAVAILESLPRTPERTLRTIRICLMLGQALQSRGFADPRSEQAFTRAWALSDETDDPVQLFQATIGRMAVYTFGGRFILAEQMSERLVALMAQMPFPPFLFVGHLFIAMAQYHSSTLAECRVHLDQTLELGEMPQPTTFMNFWVAALSYTALTLLHQGYPDQARQRAEQALARAATETPFVQAIAATWISFVYLLTRDTDGLAPVAEIAIQVGGENGFAMPQAVGSFASGWLQARRGEHEAGIAAMRVGIEAAHATGQVTSLPMMVATLAEAHGNAGQLDEALQRIAETHALIQATGEIRFAAEAHRIEGEIQRQRGDSAAAAQSFARALEIARAQQARWWELRAAVSQARLMEHEGERDRARRALAPILAGFSEGNQTEDVRAARDLLGSLS